MHAGWRFSLAERLSRRKEVLRQGLRPESDQRMRKGRASRAYTAERTAAATTEVIREVTGVPTQARKELGQSVFGSTRLKA
jgi:hypothetical protein